MTTQLTDDELMHLIEVELPELLESRPHLQSHIYRAFIRLFATREKAANRVSATADTTEEEKDAAT